MPSFSLDEFRARPPSGELIRTPLADLDSDALAEFPSEARPRRPIALPIRLGKKPHLVVPLLVAILLGAMGGLWWVFAGPVPDAPGRPSVPLPATFLAVSGPVALPVPPESAIGLVVSPEASDSTDLRRVTQPARVRPAPQVVVAPQAVSRPAAAKPLAAPPAPPATPVDETVYASFAEQAPPAPDDAATRVYSAGEQGVEPPVAARAWFFTAPPEGIARGSLTQVEVVVSPRGDVESARIVAGPRTYTDGMILSAIKGGTFRPAQKDGQPVAYRQTLWVVVPNR